MTAEVLIYPPCWYLGHYECQRQTFAENDGQNEDDDDYNGKDSNHDDEVKVDCENQEVIMVCGGEPKGTNLFIPVCPALKVMLHGTIRNDDFQCNTRPTFE